MNSALISLPPLAAAAPAKTARLTRTGDRIRSANRWRAQYDPLRSFTLSRAVALREAWFRGEMADVQWTYLWAETSDPDLFALRELRSAAIAEMDWNIKTVSDSSANYDPALAEAQAHALRAAYDALPNLTEVIDHLATATFRGYAHVEKQRDPDGRIARLEIVDQWNVVRDGFRGPWRYNPEARNTNFVGLSDQPELNDDNCIIALGTDRHINFYALPKFVRCSMVEKDWTAFLEIYGLPSGVITMGPNQNPDAAADEADAAASIAEGGSGVIPYGATYSPNDSPRGVDPFSPFLRAFSEKLILVGTGGKLTMLAESGAGTLAGNAHADSFRTIARAEARRINSLLQRHIDRDLLAREFPGQPVLAYFELDYQEKTDPAALIDQAVKLTAAGFTIDPEELSEKTGWTLAAAAEEPEAAAAAKAKGKRQKAKGEENGPDDPENDPKPEKPSPDDSGSEPPTVQNRRIASLQGPARGSVPGGAILTLPADQNASYAKNGDSVPPLPAGEGRGDGEPPALLNTFDPDQPRAADGKWTGSAGSGNHTTDSPEFKEWFGKSKVVDKDGKPLVVHHGGAAVEVFNPRAGEKTTRHESSALGVFFSDDQETARQYGKVSSVFLRIENPLTITERELGELNTIAAARLFRMQAKRDGYDGLIVKTRSTPGFKGGTEYVVFDSTQIKSATGNSGKFSRTDPRIANVAAAPPTPRPTAALRAAFAEIEKLTDPDAQRAALLALRERLPDHLRHLNRTPALAPVIESALATGWLEALTANPQTPAAPPAKATKDDVVANSGGQKPEAGSQKPEPEQP